MANSRFTCTPERFLCGFSCYADILSEKFGRRRPQKLSGKLDSRTIFTIYPRRRAGSHMCNRTGYLWVFDSVGDIQLWKYYCILYTRCNQHLRPTRVQLIDFKADINAYTVANVNKRNVWHMSLYMQICLPVGLRSLIKRDLYSPANASGEKIISEWRMVFRAQIFE